MNSAQPLTNPITLDSGTYSPNGTKWILSYLLTIPRSVNKNAVLRRSCSDLSTMSIDPTSSGTCQAPESSVSKPRSVASRRRMVGEAVSGHTIRSGRWLAAARVSSP
jgi:hypothetical protein